MRVLLLLLLSLTASLGSESSLEEFLLGNRKFTSTIYNELLADNDNILVSPFSLETVLALTQSGAGEATAQEIRSSLHLPETAEDIASAFKSILPTLSSDRFSIQSANKIYVENNFPINTQFKNIATDIYQAELESIEFIQNVEAAEEINRWVEGHTNNKIHEVVSPQDLDAYTKVLLVNTLYFQGNWTSPFQSRLTKKAKFFINSDTTTETDTMFQEVVEYNYAESEELDAQILEMPFDGEGASMTVILPNQKEGIAVLEKNIETALTIAEFNKEFVQVSLPKFRIESSIDFNTILQNLGMLKAFDPTEADFSGIAGEPGDLYLGKIKQKTFIDVKESGVEAAAASSIVVPIDPSVPSVPTKFFVADHPFFFYIKVNNVVLFEGKVLVPHY